MFQNANHFYSVITCLPVSVLQGLTVQKGILLFLYIHLFNKCIMKILVMILVTCVHFIGYSNG